MSRPPVMRASEGHRELPPNGTFGAMVREHLKKMKDKREGMKVAR